MVSSQKEGGSGVAPHPSLLKRYRKYLNWVSELCGQFGKR
jgi:hypothetical protein